MERRVMISNVLGFTILIVGIIVLWSYYVGSTEDAMTEKAITNFEECANAGYPIMESYPEQCCTSEGQCFTNGKQNVEPPIVKPIGPDLPIASDDEVKSISDSINKFSFDMYDQLAPSGKNIFYSPFSIHDALTMTYEGARGETATEMENVLSLPVDKVNLNPSYKSLLESLKGDNTFDLSVANAIWPEKDYAFLPEYISIVEDYYLAETKPMDYKNDPAGAVKEINDWAKEETNGKIKDLLQPSDVNPMTRMVLTNAIYFKADWMTKFKGIDTLNMTFNTCQGKTSKVPMMRMWDESFPYTEGEGWKAISLPYKGDKTNMLIILPDDMSAFEAGLDEAKFNEIKTSLSNTPLDAIMIPKFKLETEYRLSDVLKAMGMPLAFTFGPADFSGMDGTRMLYISDVVHKAFVDVAENGTEAAAATAVIMAEGMAMPAPPKPKFIADKPFIFAIVDDNSGAILFLGRIVDPKGENTLENC